MPEEKIKPYKYVSQIYSHLMRSIKYDKWAEYIYNISAGSVPENARLLELAGGNGKLASHMQKYYSNIIVTDISHEMLLESKSGERQQVCCDMKSLPFKTGFDLIYCAFDSINYLTTRKALNEFFSEVKTVMGRGSIFTFDVSLENNSIRHERHLNRSGTCGNLKFIQRSKYDRARQIHINDFSIVLSTGETIREIHRQKIYPLYVFFDILEQNGYWVKQCYNAFSFSDADENSDRVQFVVARNYNA